MDDHTQITPENEAQSLPFLMDSAALLRVRILPAEFARLLGVSKQTVSQWIKAGKLTINLLDGRLDVQAAIQQVLRNTDPGRLRARVLRQAVEDVQGLRNAASKAHDRIEALEAELAEAKAKSLWYSDYADQADCEVAKLEVLLIEREAELRATPDSEGWGALLKQLSSLALDQCDQEAELDDLLDKADLDGLRVLPGLTS